MNGYDLMMILDELVNMTARRVAQGGMEMVRNERFLHHMFSFLVARRIWADGQQPWQEDRIRPEEPTQGPLAFTAGRAMNAYSSVESVQTLVLGGGKRGNIDFVLLPRTEREVRTAVEWKGPNLYSYASLVEVFLKLLAEPASTAKVVAAVFTRLPVSVSNWQDLYVYRPFNQALRFIAEVYGINDPWAENVSAFIAAIDQNGRAHRLAWGRVMRPLGPNA